jgi:prolyl oligopeptidase
MRQNRFLRHVAVALLLALALTGLVASAQERKPYPKTKTDNVSDTLHGVTITDPYRWLEDKDSPETRAWLNEQIKYTEEVLGALPGREHIKKRLTEMMRIDTIGLPIAAGDYYFSTRRRADQNQPVIYVRKGLQGKDEVLIDSNTLSADQMTTANLMDISEDGKLIAYGIRQGGEDEVTVSFLNVDSRKELTDRLPKGRIGISILPDRSGLYYTRFDNKIGPRVYYHQMGTDAAGDKLVFGEGYNPAHIIGAGVSRDGRYLTFFVQQGSSGNNEILVQNLQSKGPIVSITKGIEASFGGTIIDDTLYVRTNWKAPKWRIMAIDMKNPAQDKWRELIPEGSSVLSGFNLVGGKLFVNYLENVSTRIRVFEPTGKHVRDISFPTLGSSSGMMGQWDKSEGFYSFNSFAQPTTIYRYDVASGKQEVWARLNIPVQTDQIEVKQVWYESKDKTKIPMFIVHKKGLKLDGNRPTYLTGYGGFNLSSMPGFSSAAAFWAENGGVYALPNLRGGGEFGESWHKAGMLENKQNVFDDFIAAAEYLINNKYTSPSKLAISGGSNGGLLVGAAMTQRPEMFQAVICGVPLLDMVRYHKFLVARFWVPEYGSADNPDQFKYIHAYSPYHRVKPGTKYPAVMFVTGDSDTRVDPLHARKMTALMQAATGSGRPVLLHYDTKAGHSGGLPLTKQIENLTDQMSFLFWQLGVNTQQQSASTGR